MDDENLHSLIKNNPIAFSGFRAIYSSSQGKHSAAAERNEVPYIFSPLFIPILCLYICFLKIISALKAFFRKGVTCPPTTSGHIFIMTSTHEYRRYGFEQLAENLGRDGKEVLFLCSPNTSEYISDWNQAGFRTISFTEILIYTKTRDILNGVIKAVILTRKLDMIARNHYSGYSYRFTINSIFLEHIKSLIINEVCSGEQSVHTYSLMPYQVKNTCSDKLYLYQHGNQRTPDEDTWAAMSFFPTEILVWGDAWQNNFEQLAHPNSRIHVVGNPWFDHLRELSNSYEPKQNYDILFIANSQVASTPERQQSYEKILKTVVQECETNDWSLAIKLHPNGDIKWYKNRDLEKYVVKFEGIHEALMSADIAVTHFSSAFVESIVLGTPVILNESWSFGMDQIRPINGASFVKTENLGSEMKTLIKDNMLNDINNYNNELFDIGDSVDNIVKIITE